MTTQETLKETIANIDRLLDLKRQQIEKLKELRKVCVLADRAGVHPNEIARSGYDPATDKRWKNWQRKYANTDGPRPVTNYVILRDGRRVDFEAIDEE